MNIQQLSVADAIASVHDTPQGLTTAEAARRLHEFGPNRIQAAKGQSPLLRLLRESAHFFALMVWLAAALALLADWRAPDQGMARFALVMVCVIVVSGLFSFWQEFRVERTRTALKRALPQ